MAPRKDVRVVLVMELTRASSTSEDQPWGITMSLPGREGTYSVGWGKPGQHLDGPQLEDLLTWVSERLEHTVLTLDGLQEPLWR
jgi:hypothetical protein